MIVQLDYRLANGAAMSIVVNNNRTNTVQRSTCCFPMIVVPGDQCAYVMFRLFELHLA